MSTIKDLQHELKNKERSIKDLIRFISTRTDNNPNYSLLMGAGCSVTSGVKSATALIREWKKDIYTQEEQILREEYAEEIADEYFAKQVWYDSRNPYCALFERKYDLPRQRRMFIEQEVGDKKPSIGYAYLMKLVEKSYFKTLFTTNFDDLLNEAFYQYSHQRPIICAHDSSINSITITSKRPKIIKLHGDYLFDDIKSTLRETESLEDNIRNKFIEFSKDYGLIVIGYGGNDRSIIDVLTYLLKNEDYFKNGIYWCLREDSEINEDLRKLLWKDKVYYVKIDGFDELLAEVHGSLNNSMLPIDSSYLNEKKNKIISQLINNPFLNKTTNTFIRNDFEKLNKTRERDVISNFFKYIDQKEDDQEEAQKGFRIKAGSSEKMTEEEKKYIISLNEELYTSNFEYACELIDKKIGGIDTKSSFYRNLINSKAKCLRKLNRKEEAANCYKELVALDKKNIKYYILISQLLKKKEEKLEFLDEAIEIDPYYAPLYFEKANILFQNYVSHYAKEELNYSLKDVEDIIKKCIDVSPSISNPAWPLQYDLIKEKNQKDEISAGEIEELISKLKKQDEYHPQLISFKVKLFRLQKKDPNTIYDYIESCIARMVSNEDIKSLELLLLREFDKENDKEKLKKRLIFIEENYEVDNDYWELKAQFELEKFNNLESAIDILQSIKVKRRSTYSLLFQYLIYNRKFQEARLINDQHLGKEKFNEFALLEAEEDFSSALILLREIKEDNPFDKNLNISESYLLLKTNQNLEAYNFLNKCLKASNFTEPYFLVNYYIASKRLKPKDKKEKIKEKLLNGRNYSDLVQAAAYALIEDEKTAFQKLNKVITSDYSRKYSIKDFIVFEELIKKERFKKLVA